MMGAELETGTCNTRNTDNHDIEWQIVFRQLFRKGTVSENPNHHTSSPAWGRSGVCYYLDASPSKLEMATSESPGALATALAIKAGEIDLARRKANCNLPFWFTSNTTIAAGDYQASSGAHENYCVKRGDFDRIIGSDIFALFLALRPIVSGTGGYYEKEDRKLSPHLMLRAKFHGLLRGPFTQALGDGTTRHDEHEYNDRGIINSRDDPLSNPEQYARVHLICGEHNPLMLATAIKFFLTSLVIEAIADNQLNSWWEKFGVREDQILKIFKNYAEKTAGWCNEWVGIDRGSKKLCGVTALDELVKLLKTLYSDTFREEETFLMTRLEEQLGILKVIADKDLPSEEDLLSLSPYSDWARKILLVEKFVAEEAASERDKFRSTLSLDYHRMGLPGMEEGENRESALLPFTDNLKGVAPFITASDIENFIRGNPFRHRAGLRGEVIKRLCSLPRRLANRLNVVRLYWNDIHIEDYASRNNGLRLHTPDPYEAVRDNGLGESARKFFAELELSAR
jgi:proteasome accessory factor A